jgi:hypothetical protein
MIGTKMVTFAADTINSLVLKKFILLAVALFAAALLFGKSSLYRFLAPTQRADTDLLVIEGWTNREGLEQAAHEIDVFGYQRAVVASLAYPHDSTAALEVHSEGGLTFNLIKSDSSRLLYADSVTVVAASVTLQNIPAHFRLWVNDSVVGDHYTRETLAPYGFRLSEPVPLCSVTVEFDNDGYVEGVGDRNLLVQSVVVNGQTFLARMPNVRYDRGAINGNKRYRTDHRSEADEAAEWLIRSGVSEAQVITVAAPPTDYDRTYATAVAVRNWLARQPGGMPAAINVLSESTHARRSRLLYQKAFGSAVLVGIIAIPRHGVSADNWWETPAGRTFTLSQIAKYLYVRLFFWPDPPPPDNRTGAFN